MRHLPDDHHAHEDERVMVSYGFEADVYSIGVTAFQMLTERMMRRRGDERENGDYEDFYLLYVRASLGY